MTDLTEQWKKGELPEGLYYVEYKVGGVYIDEIQQWYNEKGDYYFTDFDFSDCIEHVLAPVPTFEELKQLKELLRECELWFTGTVGNMNDKNCGEHNRNLPIGNFEYMFKVFSQKINNALED